jgi:benzylsuccinate CoA-transferase BbsF subunit
VSAYEAACTLLGPELMEAESQRRQTNPRKSSQGFNETALCGCYPCRGVDRWCAIVVADEKQWRAFCRISGKSELSAEIFSSASKRKKNRSELDRLISDWTSTGAAENVVRRLQRNGIAAAVVQDAEDLARDRQFAARRFFVYLDHPILGKSHSDRSALWPWKERPDWKAAPRLGEDNRYVFMELLGCSDAQLQSLIKKGAVR